MKSIYYLAHEANLRRFDALFTELDMLETSWAIEKIPSLVAFIAKDKTVSHQNFILIDVSHHDWSLSHILSAVQQLHRFSSAQLIFLSSPSEETTELFAALARVHHVEYFITETEQTDTEAQLRSCLLEEPRPLRRMKAVQDQLVQEATQTASPLHIPEGLVIQVSVAGSMPRCGTTTQVFAVYHYLKLLGFSPAVWDKTEKTISLLRSFYPDDTVETDYAVEIQGIPFCQQVSTQFNAYILDYGVLTPQNSASFSLADLSVLTGGTKAWELPAFAQALSLLEAHPCQQLVTIASFSTQKDIEQLGNYLGEHSGCAPYHPNLWEASSPRAYETLLLPRLKEICGEEASA